MNRLSGIILIIMLLLMIIVESAVLGMRIQREWDKQTKPIVTQTDEVVVSGQQALAPAKYKKMVVELTYYCACKHCCGKYKYINGKRNPAYGRTAMGTYAKAWHTISMKGVKLGTKVYIPKYKDKPNKGIFVVEDRGVGYNKIDVFVGYNTDNDNWAHRLALKLGRQRNVAVYIME